MTVRSEAKSIWPKVFATTFGLFLAVGLLKFGTPSVMDRYVAPPTNLIEGLIFVWPQKFAYVGAAIVAVLGILVCRWQKFGPTWLLALPAIWFTWQLIAATQSIDPNVSRGVICHFAICIACFYLGAQALTRSTILYFLLPILIAFAIVLYVGFDQHFGGLEATRKFFWAEIYPTLPNVPAEYIRKMQSNRIFSTVFYPNAFAGLLLLLTPLVLTWIWQAKTRFTAGARGFLCGAMGLSIGGCFYWTGSKGGWLLAIAIGAIAFLHQRASQTIKYTVIAGIILLGTVGFLLKNHDYFSRGATSVGARFDYWAAAVQTTLHKPLFGTGPGTFAISYERIKKPESEMARLTHNDYLQQASDSGLPGFFAYLGLVSGLVWHLYRNIDWQKNPIPAAAWLGFFAWSLQSAFEFTLYVPSVAWLAFAIAGWNLRIQWETSRQGDFAIPNISKK